MKCSSNLISLCFPFDSFSNLSKYFILKLERNSKSTSKHKVNSEMELYQAVFTVGLLFYEMSPPPDPREWQISGLCSLLLITCTHKCELQSFNHCGPIILGLARQTACHIQCTDMHKAFRTMLGKCQNKPE